MRIKDIFAAKTGKIILFLLIGALISAAVLLIVLKNGGRTEMNETKETSSGASGPASSESSASERHPWEDPDVGVTDDGTADTECLKTIKEIDYYKKAGDVNYIFITDLHADSFMFKEDLGKAKEFLRSTLEYAVKIANEGDIDFICVAGDNVDSYVTKSQYKEFLKIITDTLKKSKKPVIMARGNHDNNHNKGQAASEHIGNNELYDLTQGLFRRSDFVYDDTVEKGLYFYYDIPEKKTRVICLDTWEDAYFPYAGQQSDWLKNKVLTGKDEGRQYIFVQHMPLTDAYSSVKGKPQSMGDSENVCRIIADLNNRRGDFADFKSHITAVHYGHTHAGYIEYNSVLGCFCANSPAAGIAWPEQLDNYPSDSRAYGREKMTPDNMSMHQFDIFLTGPDRLYRIRFGSGSNKEFVKK